MKYLASFRTTLKVSRYLFRALALLIWLLIAFVSVFYIVNALHQRESEIRQEFNLSSDQAQRFIQRTSDVMKELKYIAENRLTAENGVMSSRARDDKMVVPDFEPLFADSDCAAMGSAWRGSLESLAWFMRYWRDNFSAAYDLNRVFLIGSDNLCMANFGLREMPVERDDALKALHERIMKYRNAPQEESGNNLFWISQGARQGVGYFYALTPVYLANRLQALLGVEQSIRMENFFTPGSLPMGVTIIDENGHSLISLTGLTAILKRSRAGCRSAPGLVIRQVFANWYSKKPAAILAQYCLFCACRFSPGAYSYSYPECYPAKRAGGRRAVYACADV